MSDSHSSKQLTKASDALLSLLLGVTLWLFSSISSANLFQQLSTPKFLPVEQAFQIVDQQLISQAGAPKRVAVSWQLEPGYYLYQHRFSAEPLATEALPEFNNNAVQFSQPGIAKFDEAFGDIIAFYDQVTVTFQLPESGIVNVNYQGCADAGLCYPPQTHYLDLSAELAALPAASDETAANSTETPASPADKTAWFRQDAPWLTLGLFFLMGIGLTFTPCVLPMVPILSSLIMGQTITSARRGFILSLVYVLGMAITYAIAGTMMGLLGASANLQSAMQAPAILIAFAALFVALALSMFGLYELALPRPLQNRLTRVQQRQQGGSLLGVGFMGALSALVVSPCISAPLAGALVYLSTTGDALLGGSALFALALGMGLPLIVIATTGLRILPKSGPWMEQVKVLFGVLLLLVAIWLLQRLIADALILISVGAVLFLYGIALGALQHQPAALAWSQRLPKGFAWLLLIYGASAMIGGLQGNTSLTQPLAKAFQPMADTQPELFYKTADVGEINDLINQSTTPVMIDIYADWCISCKVMERQVFAHPDTLSAGKNLRWLKLDMTANNASHIQFLQDHQLFGPPAVLFYRQGQEITQARLIGEVTRKEFVQHLNQLPQM